MTKVEETYENPKSDLNIPTSLLQYVLTTKQTNHFSLFLYLKFQYRNGQFTSFDKELAAQELGVTVKTIENRFKKLIALRYINHDKNINLYYIKGFTILCNMLRMKSTHSVLFTYANIKIVKLFCFTTTISFLLIKRKWMIKEWKRVSIIGRHNPGPKKQGHHNGKFDALHKIHTNSLSMLPSKFLGRLLDMSISTISEIKKSCRKARLMEVEHNYAFLTKECSFATRIYYEQCCPEISHRLVYTKDGLKLVLADSFTCNVKHTKRK